MVQGKVLLPSKISIKLIFSDDVSLDEHLKGCRVVTLSHGVRSVESTRCYSTPLGSDNPVPDANRS